MNCKYIKPVEPIKLGDIIKHIQAEVIGNISYDKLILDICDLGTANSNELSFINNIKYLSTLRLTKAYAVIVDNNLACKEKSLNIPFLVVKDPYLSFAKVMQLFYPPKVYNNYISTKATINKSAIIGKNCHISDGAFIGNNVTIGNNVYIGPNSVITNDVVIGDNTVIHSLVSIKYSAIGKDCIIHDGVRIGQDGFGFAPNYNESHVKIPQVGSVIVEDDVEIGANTCIDRGTINNTIIKKGTKIDNLVQIGHNVNIGKNCFIGGQVGIAGSCIIEDKVAIAGQSGLAPYVKVGEEAKIAPKSGVFRDIPKNITVMGIPTRNFFDGMRLEAIFNKLLKNNKTKTGLKHE